MDVNDKSAMKLAYPEHHFLRLVHPLGEAVLALPRKQSTAEKTAAAELWGGSTVTIKEWE